MNYYNENDKKAAAWLRELIKAKLIPEGEVDERSIRDVSAVDVRGFKQCHFFAGIGGWAYALQLAGWPEDEEVWTGSCPCQPFSVAGKREVDADERHLWPAFRRLLDQCRPATAFGEQVAGKDGRIWLARVRADMEKLGYRFGAADLCAAGLGAPHIRQRLFWVAESGRASEGGILGPTEGARSSNSETNGFSASIPGEPSGCGATDGVAHSEHDGGRTDEPRRRPEGREADGRSGGMADAASVGRQSIAPITGERGAGMEPTGPISEPCSVSGNPDSVADAEGGGLRINGSASRQAGHTEQYGEDGRMADTNGSVEGNGELQRGGQLGQQPENSGTVVAVEHAMHQGPQGRRLRSGKESRQRTPWAAGFEIIRCTDGKARRFESGSFPLADGFSGRVGLLRGYGNAIVPQVAAEFVGAYLDIR